MKKAKKIIEDAKSKIAETKKMISVSDAVVHESKQSIETEKLSLSKEKFLKSFAKQKKIITAKSSKQTKSKKQVSTEGVEANENNPNRLDFPVVGIGASAGGLEALQIFFEHIIGNPGVAFVIIQHLSPDHNSFMEELLRRYTTLPIEFIKDNTTIEKNHIYLIPPKVNIVLKHGILYHQKIKPCNLNLPIDIFFHSLAEDQQSNAVAIILSGAGTDGTLGIRAIKEFGGIAIVQDPRDAKFDGMPKSAMATNMVDFVKPVSILADDLLSYLQHPFFAHSGKVQQLATDNNAQYNRIMEILRKVKKINFSAYRLETISRRLEKRMSINRFNNLSDYVEFLEKNPQEIETLFHEILIGVTRFFRDFEAFSSLSQNCFSHFFKDEKNQTVRIWVASCSTGEEAYSIAILLKDYMQKNRIIADVKIFATDIDEKALKFAAIGYYPQNIVSDIPTQYLAKYFSPRGNGYQIVPEIRKMIVFANQDLIDNPPFFKLDLITCRNFLIYINPESQQRIISSFYVGLKQDGFLFLGPSESLADLAKCFAPVDKKNKIFKKLGGFNPEYSPKTPVPLHLSMLEYQKTPAIDKIGQENLELLSILEQVGNVFLNPSLIIDSSYNIIYTIRGTESFLKRSSGRVTTNLLKILPKDLGIQVSSVIRRAEGRPDIIVSEINLNNQLMIVKCKHIISENSSSPYFYISFEEIQKTSKYNKSFVGEQAKNNEYQRQIDVLEEEVLQQKESLRYAIEQLESSNEELQASNEELVASNEELQSSNEELQSVNEELYTVNIEHVRKLEEISELNYDYENLLSNTQIGTLFLDSNLVIRKISRTASELTGILQNDVGRPLHYFSLRRLYSRFVKDVEKVHATQKQIEKELVLQGKIFYLRIVPYLVEENKNKGLIITFVDLTDCKMRAIKEANESQEKVKVSTSQLEAAALIAKIAYFQIDLKTKKCTGGSLLKDLYPLKNGYILSLEEWIYPEDLWNVKAQFNKVLEKPSSTNVLFSFRSKYFGELRYYRMSITLSTNALGNQMINGVIQNVTDLILSVQQQNAREKLWNDSLNATPVLFYVKDADHEFRFTFVNRYFLEFFGKKLEDVLGKTDKEIILSQNNYRKEDLLVLQSENSHSFESQLIDKEGTVHYFQTIKQKNIISDNHHLIVGIGSDITEQRMMMNDMQMANQCLAILLDSDDFYFSLQKIMDILCKHMQAIHCFWISFDHNTKMATCKFEYVVSPKKVKFFKKEQKMPFTVESEWYKCLQDHHVLDIPDLLATTESAQLSSKYFNLPKQKTPYSLFSYGLHNGNFVEGSIGFIYSDSRPKFSPERLTYLMTFVATLFRTVLHKQQKGKM